MKRFAVAKDKVIQHLGDIVPELFGRGEKQTREIRGSWQVLNRWRPRADMSQMKVWPGGAWKDFAGDARGDAMDLVAYGLTGAITRETRMIALEWVEDRFGLRHMDAATRSKIEEEGRRNRLAMEAKAAADLAKGRDRARKAFYAGEQDILGTPVDTYFKSRGIDLRAVPNLSKRSFRYRPDGDYWMAGSFGVSKADRAFPVLQSAMVDGAGQLGAVHYTFLEPDGSRKLDTLRRGWFEEKADGRRVGLSAKLMFPNTLGLEIRVTWGDSGMSCEDAAANGVVGWFGHTEGIEDALTVGLSDPALRMHAAGSLSAYLQVPDHAAAEGHLLFRDNDWDKPQAVELFDQALARMKSFGKPVEAVAMPAAWGKDANDVLNWKGPGT